MHTPPPLAQSEPAAGLPYLRSWRSVYFFVLIVLVLWVVVLTVLPQLFS